MLQNKHFPIFGDNAQVRLFKFHQLVDVDVRDLRDCVHIKHQNSVLKDFQKYWRERQSHLVLKLRLLNQAQLGLIGQDPL